MGGSPGGLPDCEAVAATAEGECGGWEPLRSEGRGSTWRESGKETERERGEREERGKVI